MIKKVILLLTVTVFFSGCFLVISHEDREPSILAVHILPPKLEGIKPERPIDSFLALFPFYFDMKFSEKGYPYFLDYSHIPREFNENLAVLLENGIFSKVDIAGETTAPKDKDYYIKTLQDLKYDSGIYGVVKKFNIEKKGNRWKGEIMMNYNIVTYDGFTVGSYEIDRIVDEIEVPDNLIAPYEVAYVASALLNNVYEEIVKNALDNREQIETHRSLKEIIKGKGIITFRKLGKMKGRSKVLIDTRIRIMLNDLPIQIFASKEKKEEAAKKYLDNIQKDQYKLILTVREVNEELNPLKTGRLVYDSFNDVFWIFFQEVKEFNVSPGKALVVGNFSVPKVKETITKGIYIDINPEKATTMGLNILVDTKNNLVDMGFVK